MDIDKERLIDKFRPQMEAIVFLRDGTVEKVETPYGREIPPGERSPAVQGVVEMYSNWPHKVTARLFVYPNGAFGASLDD